LFIRRGEECRGGGRGGEEGGKKDDWEEGIEVVGVNHLQVSWEVEVDFGLDGR
jgi:hypothetical protein